MIVVDKSLCDFCGTCVAVCEPDAIDLYFRDIKIDSKKCIECQKCVWVCPIGAAKRVKEPGMDRTKEKNIHGAG